MIFREHMVRLATALVLRLLASPPVGAGTVSGKVALIQNGVPRTDASNAVVWIEGVHQGAIGAMKGEMKSSSKRFLPRVVAIPKNATVDFPNADPIYHNVFSVSGANRFDLGLYRSGASKSKRFEEAGLVRIYCNIHPQMVGFVMVVDSDLVAITGPDGSFKFDGVPPGSYVVKAWHEEGTEVAHPVAVKSGGDAPLALRIDVSAFKPEPHKNKYGKEYPPKAGESDDERY
jgi:plastocyanin